MKFLRTINRKPSFHNYRHLRLAYTHEFNFTLAELPRPQSCPALSATPRIWEAPLQAGFLSFLPFFWWEIRKRSKSEAGDRQMLAAAVTAAGTGHRKKQNPQMMPPLIKAAPPWRSRINGSRSQLAGSSPE